MDGLRLLLWEARQDERTHQNVLYTLLKHSDFYRFLPLSIPLSIAQREEVKVEREPEVKLFDLGLFSRQAKVLFEIKVMASLSSNQHKRQQEFLMRHREDGYKGVYVFLGKAWFERTGVQPSDREQVPHEVVGYEELIASLDRLIHAPGYPPENPEEAESYKQALEVARVYKEVLERDLEEIKEAYRNPDGRDVFFYYSLFWQLQQRLGNVETEIYTVSRDYILHKLPLDVSVDGNSIGLYCEVANDRLRIKFFAPHIDENLLWPIYEKVREATRTVLGEKINLIPNRSRKGRSMTVWEVDHDFARPDLLDQSAEVFATVAQHLDEIKKRLESGV